MSDEDLTLEQQRVAGDVPCAFVEACPGSGKTRAIVARLSQLVGRLPPRQGIAVLSFTNTAVEELMERCHVSGVASALRHPGFIGTFDAFLRHFFVAPSGIHGVRARPTVVDGWNSLGIEVRLLGRSAFRGPGVGLDLFDAETNHPATDRIGHAGLRAHVRANQAAYEQAAARRREGLRRKGYLSAADMRVEALRRLEDGSWSSALGKALAARFHEVIVDEAQDCNPLDLRILEFLRQHDLRVTVVADPDQAIYGFRHGDPANLQALKEKYVVEQRLSLTGNFRSSDPICKLAATLRARALADAALGKAAAIAEPIRVLAYQGRDAPAETGAHFVRIARDAGISASETIVLAHARRVARRACGLGPVTEAQGDSKVARMARCVAGFWGSPAASGQAREAALRSAEGMILQLMGRMEEGESPIHAAERHAIDRRWLRRTALELVTRIPRSCDDNEAGRNRWVAVLRDEVRRLGLTYATGLSEGRYFRSPGSAEWSGHLRGCVDAPIRCATVHEAKGREFDAVCVVLPGDRGGTEQTARLLEAWVSRSDDEAKRVVYVGVTRARKLVALAVPRESCPRVVSILRNGDVPHVVEDLAVAPPA